MARIPSFGDANLQAVCDVLGKTNGGLTGGEIGKLLSQLQIADPQPTITKKDRLYQALHTRQARDGCGNNVIAFMQAAMAPVRFAGRAEVFDALRAELNEPLAFVGYALGEDGLIRVVPRASTLPEAENRARALQRKLSERGVHADVLRFCRAELLQDNYFHAVLEATKSVAQKIREMTGLVSDGDDLVKAAFGGNTPLLAINSLRTDTEWSEQRGFGNLLRGMFGTFRAPSAHAPKIYWPIDEPDALDLLTLASYFHRRLDRAVRPNWSVNP